MKKKSSMKIIIIWVLTVLCVAILIGTYFLNRQPKDDFTPSATEPEPAATTWKENTNTAQPADTTQTPEPSEDQKEGSSTDQTQKVTSEDETGTVSSLSDTKGKTKKSAEKNKPEKKPETTESSTPPGKPPEYVEKTSQPEPTTAPEKDKANDPTVPQKSDENAHAGKVYDPVFGWIETGKTQQDNVDSDGDIDKQVGTMD